MGNSRKSATEWRQNQSAAFFSGIFRYERGIFCKEAVDRKKVR